MTLASSPTTAQSATTGPMLSETHVLWVALGLGIIALIIVLLPLLLALTYNSKRGQTVDPATGLAAQPSNFFDIPFITWFLVHYGIAALAIVAIVLLGIDNVIDKGTVSALLGSLFGYVLGSSAHSTKPSNGTPTPTAAQQPPPTPSVAVEGSPGEGA